MVLLASDDISAANISSAPQILQAVYEQNAPPILE
jgi:hypothetical protein